ncbi:MAG TPA: hypothetical protein VMB26_06070 [Candidatus Binataceae bacterium]|nr:hypothetical protein [Candidatus Binataceae bacterium]
MKTFLMHPDRDFDVSPPPREEPLHFAQDIELAVLLDAAAANDPYLYNIMSAACASAWANDIATIRYRQMILKDCLVNPSIVRQFYAIAMEPFSRERSWDFSLLGHEPASMVGSAVRTLRSCLDVLRRLRITCSTNESNFSSDGFRQFFRTLERDLDDAYLEAAGADLKNLTFGRGVLLSAQVGEGGKGVGTILRKPQLRDLSWIRSIFTLGPPSFTLQLHPRDEAGAYAFEELQNRGLSLISGALFHSAEHVRNFLKSLRAELAFYIGCINLSEQLSRIGEAIAFPEATEDRHSFACRNLRDVCLALTMRHPVVGNDADAAGRPLVIITGVNRGGKSTFLRSVGLAQLMMQAGMFVTADAFISSLHTGLFTHYKREEDRSMRSGKFDEELARMSTIANQIRRRGMVLFNESFAATNEREGSEIARQIVSALLESDVTVFFVTHMYELARLFLGDERVLFLRADRSKDGARSFRLQEAKPLPKSFGADLYEQIFTRHIDRAANSELLSPPS